MGWFHKTLQDMERAIQREDWSEVERILKEHKRGLFVEGPKIDRDLADIGLRIEKYGSDLRTINQLLKAAKRGEDYKRGMLAAVQSAINEVLLFEKVLIRLAKEEKFLE